MKESSITGVALMTAMPNEWAEMGAFLSAGAASGGWLRPVVEKAYPIGEVQQVRLLMSLHFSSTPS